MSITYEYCMDMKIPHLPNRYEVEPEIYENIKNYMAENLETYRLVDVQRKSNHPDDHYLYMVIGKKITNNTYAVWSCWNSSIGGLAHGKYGLNSLTEASKTLDELYNDKSKIYLKNTLHFKEDCEKLLAITSEDNKKQDILNKIEECKEFYEELKSNFGNSISILDL